MGHPTGDVPGRALARPGTAWIRRLAAGWFRALALAGGRWRWPWVAFVVIGAALVMASGYAAGRLAAEGGRRDLLRQANAAAALHAAVLRSELEKHRSLPLVLADDRDVRTALQDPRRAPQALDARLEALSANTGAAVIYIVDREGVTLAASNWRLPTSFVGSNYSFRQYFKDAMRTGTAEHFALGTVSGRPGLYLARRVAGPNGPLGAVIVKVEFDRLEAQWTNPGEPTFVTDPQGVVLVTSVRNWRFRTLRPLSAADRDSLGATFQSGTVPLTPLPIRARAGAEVEVTEDAPAGRYLQASTPTAMGAWTLHLLERSDRVVSRAAQGARVTAALLSILLLIAAGLLLRRRERAATLAAVQEAARAELEARVEERTGALRTANDKLKREIEERRRAEATLLAMQDSLAQANKFATLGQIAAGVAHEINQPVAAIHSYADNALVFLGRRQTAPARDNLKLIASLTDRIGLITAELREFSRKSRGPAEPTSVDDAIAGALLLVNWRARQQGVRFVRRSEASGACVLGDRARLEQVLVNLLQNSLEALTGVREPVVEIAVEVSARKVRIVVTDNGPGLDPAICANLFTPFATSKLKGLGLGLVISRDIVTEFGGELSFKPAAGGGAEFTISLRRP
ncbi:MAG: histidine kinase [Caulobacteraceae bacterium]|nr:histidine kinase [Caulobacteraceae bacterium]